MTAWFVIEGEQVTTIQKKFWPKQYAKHMQHKEASMEQYMLLEGIVGLIILIHAQLFVVVGTCVIKTVRHVIVGGVVLKPTTFMKIDEKLQQTEIDTLLSLVWNRKSLVVALCIVVQIIAAATLPEYRLFQLVHVQ